MATKRRRFISISTILYFILISNQKIDNNLAPQITIVLDAGHGGFDSGALGLKSKEKDINLALVVEIKHALHKISPCYKVILTRKKDIFISIAKRVTIAKKNADIFVSVHCNASKFKYASGAETYVMTIDQLAEASELAKRENDAIKLESNYTTKYASFIKSESINIIHQLHANSRYLQSLDLADTIQKKLSSTKIRDRGVKQDNFCLFYDLNIPCVLIEVGYITNPYEENKLTSRSYLKKLAVIIAEAIDIFCKKNFASNLTLIKH